MVSWNIRSMRPLSKNGMPARYSNTYKTLVPLAANSAWSPALGPAHLPWLFRKNRLNIGRHKPSRTWFCCRTNQFHRGTRRSGRTRGRIHVHSLVCLPMTRPMLRFMLLPEATDESLRIQVGGTKFVEQFWTQRGWTIRQPAVEKTTDCKDMTEIATEIATGAGILEQYNQAITEVLTGPTCNGEL